MDKGLGVRLLGRPAFEAGGKDVPCAAQKAVWLAAYVFLAKSSQPRTRLASLLWGGSGQRHALGSLRVALTKLPPAVLEHLVITRDAVAPVAGVEVDVDTFTALAASEEVDALTAAVALYRGELLQDTGQDLAPEFSDWLFGERNRLRVIAAEAHVKLAKRLHAQGDRERARAIADSWLKHDPANEAMHRLMMTWLSQGAGGDQALAHYEVYRRARAVAHGAAPSEEMSSFAERLRQGTNAPSREMPARIGAATSFFGRNDELAELRALLADPACRLLTILGMGGVGKTRLSMALAEMEGAAFPGGTYVVALDGLQDPRLFAQTLARACGLQPAGSASPLAIVTGFLRDRAALVVLDNLEHLLGGDPGDPQGLPAQVATVLRETGSQLKIVATSREPLHLQEEWNYELSGLAYPEFESDGDAQGYPAVQFFAQRARQAYVGFSLAAELPNVVRLCGVLEGLPLGLELAASWVRNVPCAEIASALGERAQELRTRHVNRAVRHHTLGAVVAYSWERLPAEQREALSGLGALHGTFSREAAEQVAQASLRTLSALTEKSLLARASGGRWHLHEVVRQYAWDQHGTTPKARATRQAAVLKRRDAFYLEFLRSVRARLDSSEESEALANIEAESANIRRAWESGAAAANVSALDAAAPAWFDFLECRTFTAEGVRAADAWLEAAHRAGDGLSAVRAMTRRAIFLRFTGDNPGALSVLDEALAALDGLDARAERSQVLAAKCFTLFLLGRLEEAERAGADALGLAEAVGDASLVAAACRVRGLVLVQLGKREEGRDLERRSLAAATALGKPSQIASAHNNLALAENHLGNYAAAEAGYESALEVWRAAGNTVNVGRAVHNLGAVATRKGDYAQALDRYQSALDHLRKAGDRNLIALNLMSQGDALVRIGRPKDALAPLEQALAMAERDANMLPALDARIVLAQAWLAMGDRETATRHVLAAFEGGKQHHFTNVLADAVIVAARMRRESGAPGRQQAYSWAHAVAQLAGISVTVRRDAQELESELAPGFEPAVRETAERRELSDLVREARGALAEA